jgi:hypothetical protein
MGRLAITPTLFFRAAGRTRPMLAWSAMLIDVWITATSGSDAAYSAASLSPE